MKFSLAALMLLLLALLPAPPIAAQESPVPGMVDELPTTTVYLKDKDGKLVPVPGFSYEHYRDLVLQAERSETDPPAFAIEKLVLKGTVEEDVCRLELEAVVHVRKSGWVMVPLRLARGALRDAISSSVDPEPSPGAEGHDVIHRFDAKEGHVVWLWGGKERRHTLRLPLLTQLLGAGEERQLLLSLPKASESRLTIDLPAAVENAMLKTGDGLVETQDRDEGSQITVTGATGELTLTWRPAKAMTSRVLDLDSSSEIAVKVETRDTVGFSAKMRISRTGAVIRRLFVRLPPQTDLLPRRAKEFTSALATAEDLSEAGFDPQRLASVAVARVDFETPSESHDFMLEAAYRSSAGERRNAMELSGFEVLGAGRQTGFVTIQIPTGWSLTATPDAAAFRTDEDVSLPGQARAAARYRFVRQPFSLPVEVAPQPPRTVVEPTYIATVQPQRVTLAATLDYQVRGPRPPFVELDLAGWKLDSGGPESLVDFQPPQTDGKARLNLQPGPSGEFSLQLELHRDVPLDNLELDFLLPRAIATQALPATLLVTTVDNVVLTPQGDGIRSLVAESRVSQLPPGLAGRALVYRELPASADPPRFVATCHVRKRRITASVDGRAQIGSQVADVEQNLSLQVAYEPLSIVPLDGPADATLSDLRVTQNGQLLDVREETLGSEAGRPTRRWRVELLEPALGAVELNVRYRLSLPNEGSWQLPLLSISEEEGVVTARQQLLLARSEAEPLAFIPERPDEPGLSTSESPQGTTLSWPRRAASLALERTFAGRVPGADLNIKRQWLQLWLSPAARRDRFVAQLNGAGEQLTVELPSGVSGHDISALVDGEPPKALKLAGQSLVIDVEPSDGDLRTLELWYLLPGYSPSLLPQQRVLELPRLQGAAAPSQSWLQVLTPPNERVLYSPSPVTSEQTWRKQGLLWQRGGALTTRELEEWSGAEQTEAFDDQTNEALFMTLGQPALLDVVVWGTRWLWFCVAGGVLAVGVTAHYISRGRLAAIAGGMVGMALLATLIAPELMLSISQYAGVGILLLIAVVWSLRVSGMPIESGRGPGPASLIRRTESSRADSRSGRYGSSVTASPQGLAATTTAQEVRS